MNQRAWMLPWILQELNKYTRKTCDCGQPGERPSRVLTERKGALVTVEICVLCGL